MTIGSRNGCILPRYSFSPREKVRLRGTATPTGEGRLHFPESTAEDLSTGVEKSGWWQCRAGFRSKLFSGYGNTIEPGNTELAENVASLPLNSAGYIASSNCHYLFDADEVEVSVERVRHR